LDGGVNFVVEVFDIVEGMWARLWAFRAWVQE
jgi:hypothetical protein